MGVIHGESFMHHVRPRPVRLAALRVATLLLALGPLVACQDDDGGSTAPATVSPTSHGKPSPTAAKGIVPDLTGLTVADARNRLAELDYGMAFTDDSEIGDDSLEVTAQSPAPHSTLKPGATVTITVPGD
ncbi:PASTA domain-containing protein [Streptomyces sp. NBC_01571]|uniref:PASTA domain-containing protein n=1 Tax=Streptomyces sp. NBC_01571 TaxID=2975883 RepID=UPI0022519A67|nr:PASTA domain-containing protein [Streptomyces sp. NBC_01571]MCX4571949.1 PASTA domain-containing protein [Streptomyces sp. NBC_01571]